MNKEELVNNLGTIARSGSKQFLEEISKGGSATENSSNIIGQFGVGFYSAFMVANKVEVITKSSKIGSTGLRWISDGIGSYEIEEVEDAEIGTTIILHLKSDCREFADDDRIKSKLLIFNSRTDELYLFYHFVFTAVVKKYSNFVGHPVYLNKEQINELQPLWLMDQKSIAQEQYDEFYRFISNSYLKPRFTLHYKV